MNGMNDIQVTSESLLAYLPADLQDLHIRLVFSPETNQAVAEFVRNLLKESYIQRYAMPR